MAEDRKFVEKPRADRDSFRAEPAIPEVNVLWMSEFMSCDGDTVSLTGAMYPSLEDVVMGNIPGLPKVNLYNKVLARENGEDFLKPFYAAAKESSTLLCL